MSEDHGLPKGWTKCMLGDLIAVIRGVSYSKELSTTLPKLNFVPILRATNINGNLDFNDLVYVDPQCVSSEQMIRPGDIIIAASSGSKSVVGKAGHFSGGWEGSFGAFCMGLRPSKQIESRFIGYFLQTDEYRHRVSDLSAGSNINNLKRDHIQSFPFRLAPLNEQDRIVAKIEELFSDLDAGVAALKRAKANLKRYRAAVLKAAVEGKLTEEWRAKHANVEPASKLLERILTERRKKWEADQLAKFSATNKEPPKNWRDKYVEPTPPDTTDLAELPDGWCWAKFDQLLTYLRNGYFQSPSGADSGTPILRINAVRPMKVDLAETRFLNEIEGSVDDYFIENGDLLFTRYNGSVDLLGVAGMVRGCTEKVLHPDKLIRIKLALGEPMPSFCEIAVNVGASRKHMVGRARTTAGQTGISGPDVREMPIPFPPLDEQSVVNVEVAEKLSLMESAESAIDHGLLRAARLRQSILKQAFEGKLVPQDPKDEPADKLLERIRGKQAATNGTVATKGNPRTHRGRPTKPATK